jgi:hypothetical protein
VSLILFATRLIALRTSVRLFRDSFAGISATEEMYTVSQNYVNTWLGGSRPADRSANFWLTTVGEPCTAIKPAAAPLCSSVDLSPMAYVCLQEKNNPLMLT